MGNTVESSQESAGFAITEDCRANNRAGTHDVFAADLDGDGHEDILSVFAKDNKVVWYRNLDGQSAFGSEQVIDTEANGPISVDAADLDADGDQDVLLASFGDDVIAWYENDGSGGFGSRQVITTLADGASSVYAEDLNGDGNLDVLAASAGDDKIAWYQNTDGHGHFGPQIMVSTETDAPLSAYSADLDGDGDRDILSASGFDHKIAWYENEDGQGLFGVQRVITTEVLMACEATAADLDGDGDLDVLSASHADDRVAWYENLDRRGNFGPQIVINAAAKGARSVIAADLDRDADLDIVSGSANDDTIAWYENTDGLGNFGPAQAILHAEDARSVHAVDLDRDGDMEILAALAGDDPIVWRRNLLPIATIPAVSGNEPTNKSFGVGVSKYFFPPRTYVICQKGAVTECFQSICPQNQGWVEIKKVSRCP